MQIFKRAVELELKPVVAETACQALAEGCRAGGGFLRIALCAHADVGDIVGIAHGGEGVDIEVAGRVDGGIEHEHSECVPVAVDIFGAGSVATSLGVEGDHVGNGIVGGREVQVGHDATLMVLNVVVVEQAEVLRERGLQSGVTSLDVEGVGVVDNVEQVAH